MIGIASGVEFSQRSKMDSGLEQILHHYHMWRNNESLIKHSKVASMAIVQKIILLTKSHCMTD